MSSHIIIVDHIKDWRDEYPDVTVITSKDYFSRQEYLKLKNARIVNLCRSYRYLSNGYYCSLLAEARHHKVIPTVRTLTDLSNKAIYSLNIEDMDELVHKSVHKSMTGADENKFELLVFFGQCEDKIFQELARQIFDNFRSPLIKIEFRLQGKWQISAIKPLSLHRLEAYQQKLFVKQLSAYLGKRWQSPKSASIYRYDLAILHNPNEALPPSNPAALKKFQQVGKKMGLNIELIEKKDYAKLAEYDALFIRETTQVNHHTYRFAKKAETEGMVVIDDPDSILRCTNKVYLAELLSTNNVPRPNSVILQKEQKQLPGKIIGYPHVLKIPDGSFSRGVYKAENESQSKEIMARLFKESDLILAQEFIYTEFDWRIGILNHQPIFSCQYFMSREHWQIVKHQASGASVTGDHKSWQLENVPQTVLDTALSVAKLIGDGLYGVDIKQNDSGVYVIEINDNPNLDSGVEDGCSGDGLYQQVLEEFVRRLDSRKTLGDNSSTVKSSSAPNGKEPVINGQRSI